MITHDHGLIFIHIPKCAGRSICNTFNQRFDHFTARYYEKEYSRFWNTYTRFTIVRHPLDRLVSMYHYIQNHRRHRYEPIAVNGAEFKIWLEWNISEWKRQFEINSPEGERGTDGDIGSPFWLSGQYRRIENKFGNPDIHFIHRLEDGIEPLQEFILERTGQNLLIEHHNKSVRMPWKEYFDDHLFSIVSDFEPVVHDCLNFGYEING